MKKIILVLSLFFTYQISNAQEHLLARLFLKERLLVDLMCHWGPDNHIWVTERKLQSISTCNRACCRINVENGTKHCS